MSMSETIEWHRASEVLPESDTDVLIILSGELYVWPGYCAGRQWFSADGFRTDDVLFWADMPKGPAQ